ncbi:hypothetical protein VV089_18610 [Candidatus Merdisoma sp. JLR.KK011]|uniref:hypothetical protein n=1 Tax=Candidatus Merdisoma sp. JLR.KK011 TaxID=3114299 RepID=UPI002FF04BCE
MKKKTGKMILLTGVLCILSLAVCACGKKEEASDTQEPQVVQGEPSPEDDTENDASAPEPEADAEGTDTGNEPESPEASPEPQSGESSSQGTDSTQKEQPEAQSQSTSGTSAEWVDSTPNLEGDIKELKDGQLTVVEAITEKSDNGGDIVVSPGSGDDSEYNKIAVTYDANTLFAIQTIYDGGARSEMSAATAADLASGQFIQVWGSSSGSGLKATQICIVKVD